MIADFRIGDLVMVIEDNYPPRRVTRLGMEGRIRHLSMGGVEPLSIDVQFARGFCLWFSPRELQRIHERRIF